MSERVRYQSTFVRDNLVMSHTNTSEMYYDCLQCTEHCRHASNTITDNINVNINDNNSNTLRGMSPAEINPNFVTNYKNNCQSYYSSDLYDSARNSKMCSQIQCVTTPARKRSSLARPVRIHDSSAHKNVPAELTEFSIDERSNPGETAYYTGGLPFDDHSGSEDAWPIRLRLEEILELTLSRSKKSKRMKTRKRKKVTLTSKHTHFKDTERLLKVLSINNVDQDCRYNVKRCSIM
ncbi:uncharacterized protein LOC130663861 [Microplitis mediator]|uniref:uncharacterized protein LOC130663861 n=1 Tax=Microplitis mediator TaxID=375433 RepID=UPI0025575DDE|nr:uncharacterized protein LOC130663861 [Microplitis mediator]